MRDALRDGYLPPFLEHAAGVTKLQAVVLPVAVRVFAAIFDAPLWTPMMVVIVVVVVHLVFPHALDVVGVAALELRHCAPHFHRRLQVLGKGEQIVTSGPRCVPRVAATVVMAELIEVCTSPIVTVSNRTI